MKTTRTLLAWLLAIMISSSGFIACSSDDSPKDLNVVSIMAGTIDLNGATSPVDVPVKPTIVITFDTNINPTTATASITVTSAAATVTGTTGSATAEPASTIYATHGSSVVATVLVRDQFGAAFANSPVSVSVTGRNATTVATSLVTDATGRASKAKMSIDAGVMKDRVVLDYDWSKSPSEISFSLDEADLLTEMSGTYEITDNGDDTTTVKYQLTVALSMPVPAMMRQKAERATIDLALNQLKAKLEG